MTKRTGRTPTVILLLLLFFHNAMAQGSTTEPTARNRTLFTWIGAGAGFAAGLLIGMTVFDDAVDSDRKVWTTALVSAAAGGAGGYWLGHALDQKRLRATDTMAPLRPRIDPTSLGGLQWSRYAVPAEKPAH